MPNSISWYKRVLFFLFDSVIFFPFFIFYFLEQNNLYYKSTLTIDNNLSRDRHSILKKKNKFTLTHFFSSYRLCLK